MTHGHHCPDFDFDFIFPNQPEQDHCRCPEYGRCEVDKDVHLFLRGAGHCVCGTMKAAA